MDKRLLPSAEALQRLVERFARARWIHQAMVTPEPFAIDFTELGKERILQVVSFLEETNSKSFPDPSDFKATAKGRELIAHLEQVLKDLTPPNLTMPERHSLYGLALSFRKKFPGT